MKDFAARDEIGQGGSGSIHARAALSGQHSRATGLGRAVAGGVALTFLAAGLAQAANAPEGYVTLSAEMGVASARVLTDGQLELTMTDGSVRTIGADSFILLDGGSVAVVQAVADELLAADGLAADAVAAGGAAAVLGIALAMPGDAAEAAPSSPAVIGGVTTGEVAEDTDVILTTSGVLTVTDADAGEAAFVAQPLTGGTYGDFTLTTDGAWTYTALGTLQAIQDLDTGETLNDSFTAVTLDGTLQVVTVTIQGNTDITFNPVLRVSDIEAGIGGFAINGASAGDETGYSVSSAGDVNGDGLDDLIVGSENSSAGGPGAGASFVVFGKTDGATVELSDVLAGIGGFVITGASNGQAAGTSVSSAGDVNGDGLADLIVGAANDDTNGSNAGAVYVVFGKADTAPVDLATIGTDNNGFMMNGVTEGDVLGRSVSAVGDMNGDGLGDILVGASRDAPAGKSFVVFGKTDGAAVDLAAVETGNGGFAIEGISDNDRFGYAVSEAGDVNGDGIGDLIVGSIKADPNGSASGAAYVVFGKTDGGMVAASDIEAGVGGFVINGVSTYDYAGRSVSSAGDVNGDGFDDLIVGAPYTDVNGRSSGSAYVVFGKAGGSAVELSDIAAGTGGFAINGVTEFNSAGMAASGAGDVNGDGLDDVIVGASYAEDGEVMLGAAYVVYGKTDGATVELSQIATGSEGFVIYGASESDLLGFAVSSAGDVNGDGFADVIVGAPDDDQGANGTGAGFVVFGGNVTGAVTRVGTTGDDTLTGSASDQVIFAGTGADTVDGAGGTDRISGGAGADTFVQRNLDGTMTIIDFDGDDGDVLDVAAFGLADFAAFEALLSPEGPGGHDTRITLDQDTVVILENIAPGDLVAAHVML